MKGLGAVAVLLSSLGVGLRLVRERRQRLACLRALEEALRLMEGELSIRRPAMPELLAWTAGHCAGSAELFFRSLSLSMTSLGDRSFSELWREGVAHCFRELREEDRAELLQVGTVLGRFELSQQLAGLESARQRLRSHWEAEELRFRAEKKLLLALPLSAGCMLVLLLW